jgi:large subunit ribosomal protein L31
MRTGIHPEYVECKVHCSCGATFMTRSTKPTLNVELCSQCHPFYTGKQKFVDTGGRVQRFADKYAGSSETVITKDAAEKAARQKAHAEAEAKIREAKAAKDAAEAEIAAKAAREEAKAEAKAAKHAAVAVVEEAPAEEPVVETEPEAAVEPEAVEDVAVEESAE